MSKLAPMKNWETSKVSKRKEKIKGNERKRVRKNGGSQSVPRE